MTSRRSARPVSEVVLARVWREGEATYGPLALDRSQLAAHLADVASRVGVACEELALADLYVACAVEAGVAGAVEAMLAVHGDALRRMLTARHVTAAQAAEAVDGLGGMLFLVSAGSPFRTALGGYDGRGSLRAWLAVLLLRSALREGRVARERQDVAVPPASRAVDPADVVAAQESAARIGAELRRAWNDLPARHRIAVAMRYVHGSSGTAIAKVLGIGQPRVSRLVDAAIARLRAAVAAVPSVGDGTMQRDLVRQQLAAELANLAGPAPPEAHGGDPLAPAR